ncbi:MAG: 16S rRNA (cytosine(1402)-N(4))-methyltransferase RsmH [Deltaproteobacteria bacterium]|nr:16S rRNA (cytosine(1402)-N(4))-methyltransferase RsmH [Deltaproteobacteria bacterium]
MEFRHIPVMPAEVSAWLDCRPGNCVVDCTLGGAGHAASILEKILPNGLLIGIDQDKDAISHALLALKPYSSNISLIHDNFVNLPDILDSMNIHSVDGILADLGVSFYQIDASRRGFSFSKDELLDMRMNTDNPVTAASIVNTCDEKRLRKILYEYGEERWAPRIVKRIVEYRKNKPIENSSELAAIVRSAVPAKAAAKSRIDAATKTFMAIRIAVNDELGVLARFVSSAVSTLSSGGRLCIISFHSLEDRIVKQAFKKFEKGCTCPPDFPICACGRSPEVKILTRKPVRPKEDETAQNPMARSARLRVIEKL